MNEGFVMNRGMFGNEMLVAGGNYMDNGMNNNGQQVMAEPVIAPDFQQNKMGGNTYGSQNTNIGMNNSAAIFNNGTSRISGFVYRKMKGYGGYMFVSIILGAAIAAFLTYFSMKVFPDLYYEEVRRGMTTIQVSKNSGAFWASFIGSFCCVLFGLLFFVLFLGLSDKELNGGNFYIDDINVDYSIRPNGRKTAPILLINGMNGSIINADAGDKATFLPMLKKYDKKAYKLYKVNYYVTGINGMVIRISANGRTIYIDGTKVIDNGRQVM